MQELADTLDIKVLRKARGLSQSDLAKIIGVSQQTIDRWEKGASAPSPENLSKLEQLFYLQQPSKLGVRPLVDLPVGILSYDQFEQFVCALLQSQGHPKAHVYGGQGHKQNGIDIESSDDAQVIVQCKRVAYGNFGPQRVRDAVEVYKAGGRQDREKILAITKRPTPKEYEAAEKAGWQIWGTDKLTDMVRQLPRLKQEYLVRTYFSNRPDILRDCLGIATPSPFLNSDEYLQSAPNTQLLNSQAHYIKTRGEVLDHIVDDLKSRVPVVVLHGAGGMGKTRLLTELAKRSRNNLCFLQDGFAVSQENIARLGDSSYTIVIDNAHQHINNLQACLTALRGENIQILIVTRTYSLEKVREVIYQSNRDVNRVYEIKPLGREGALELVRDITGGTSLDERLVELARDNTLLLTLGANIVKSKQILPDKLLNDQAFSDRVGAFFDDYLGQNIDPKIDKGLIAGLIQLMAIVQPFSNDDTFLELAKVMTQKDDLSINIAINNLDKIGILQKRHGEYYIVPDLLADYECEQCLASSDYVVRRIISRAPRKYLGNIFQNLCQLDWRTQQKNLAQRALSEIWEELNQQFLSGDTNQRCEILALVQNIAIYQPGASFDLANRAFTTQSGAIGQDLLGDKVKQANVWKVALAILKSVAHIDKYTTDVLDLLVDLADQYPEWVDDNGISCPVQIMKELITIDVKYKPEWYIDNIVDYILNNCFSRHHKFSPFLLLRQVLENHAISYDGRTLYQYTLPSSFLYNTRQKIIDKVFDSLSDSDLDNACCAAVILSEVLQLETDRDGIEECTKLLERLEGAMRNHITDPIILAQIYASISWLTHRSSSKKYDNVKKVVLRAVDETPKSLDFKLALSIVDSYGDHVLQSSDYKDHQAKLHSWLSSIATEAIRQYDQRWLKLLQRLQSLTDEIQRSDKINRTYYNYQNIFYAICCESQDFAEAMVTAIIDDKVQPKTLLYYALDALARKFQKQGKVEAYIEAVAKSTDTDLKIALLEFAWRDEVFLSPDKIARIFRSTWQTNNGDAIAACIQYIPYFSQDISTLAMELLDSLEFTPKQTNITQAVIKALSDPGSRIKITDLPPSTLRKFLAAIKDLSGLDHNGLMILNQLARAKMFDKIIDVLLDRVLESTQNEHHDIWTYQPIPYEHEGVLEHGHEDDVLILSKLIGRITSEQYVGLPTYHLEALVRFLNLNPQYIMETISQLLARYNPEQEYIIQILCRSLPITSLWNRNAVSQILQSASLISSAMLKNIRRWLFCCLYNAAGVEMRQVGQPSQISLSILDITKKLLEQMPSSDRAYQFYQEVNIYTQNDIKSQKKRDEEYLADDEVG